MSSFAKGHALVVGVGGDDLPHTVDDARGIAAILKNPSRCAYPAKQIELLTGAKSGRTAILNGLQKLANAPVSSSVIIYFSGHGELVRENGKSTYYMMPHGYDVDDLDATAISGSSFADKLAAIKAKRVLVLLDCCHAGGFGVSAGGSVAKSAAAKFKRAALPLEAAQVFANKAGRVLIASSQANEVSYAGKPYSAFTMALIAALCGAGSAKEDGYVRVVDLALYTREAVTQMTEGEQQPQHPTMDIQQADNFEVAYYAAGATQAKGLPARMGQAQIQTAPASGNYRPIDKQLWANVQANVIQIIKEQTIIEKQTIYDVRPQGNVDFLQVGWNVGQVNNYSGGSKPPKKPSR